jgi:N-acetylmuramoyl-L-alanine amidase
MSNLFTPRKRTTHLVIHCAATKPSLDIGAKEIRQWHKQKGWIDIGYHFVIRRDGRIETGRPVDVVGAHVEGHNSTSVGICLVGGVSQADANVPEDNFTGAQYVALAGLLKELIVKYPNCTIKGHRDFPGVKKACPSFDVAAWLAETFPDGTID